MRNMKKGEWAIVVGSVLWDTLSAANVTVLEIESPDDADDRRRYYRVDADYAWHGDWRNASELQPAR